MTSVDAAVKVLSKHQWHHTRDTHCQCGFRTPLAQLAVEGYLRHVAEELAAAGVLADETPTPKPTPPVYATGAIVSEQDRCTCLKGLCIEQCRACNQSGREAGAVCIADPAWVGDEAEHATRMASLRSRPNG